MTLDAAAAMSPAIDDQNREWLARVSPVKPLGSPNFPIDGAVHAFSIRSKFDIGGGPTTLRDRSVGLSESEREMAQERDY
jgi:hypothetical protein